MVSVVAVAVSQAVLVTTSGLLGWGPVAANVTAVTIGSIPLLRAQPGLGVGQAGPQPPVAGGRALLGARPSSALGFSTLLVTLAHRWNDATWVVSAANLVAFGTLWVAKYPAARRHPVPDHAERRGGRRELVESWRR